MLDVWTLRVLVEVADRGSFSAAADALRMTQPAVSRQIAGLERRLGLKLFRRVSRGVALTPAGAAAVDLARGVLAGIEAMESRLRAFGQLDGAQVSLSAHASANTRFVPELIQRFSTAHPDTTVSLHRPGPVGPVDAVRAGQVDVALVTAWDVSTVVAASSADGVELLPVLDERLHVALPAGHPLARRRQVPFAALRNERWIEGAHPDCLGPDEYLEEALGAPPRIGYTCDDWAGKQALVAASAGITLVPTLARLGPQPGVTVRPLRPAVPPRRLYALVPAAPYRGPAVTALLAVLRDLVPHVRHAETGSRCEGCPAGW